jgi:hypothetical protein
MEQNSLFELREAYSFRDDDSDALKHLRVDIVAIHSLGQTADQTWTFQPTQDAPRPPSYSEPNKQRSVDWLGDPAMLPSATPIARVFKFEYPPAVETIIRKKLSLYKLAEEFLKRLENVQGSQTRPIIFIAYGFGGIILKRAVVQLSENNHEYRHMSLSSIAGMIFLATPTTKAGNLVDFARSRPIGSLAGETQVPIFENETQCLLPPQEILDLERDCKSFDQVRRLERIPVMNRYEALETEIGTVTTAHTKASSSESCMSVIFQTQTESNRPPISLCFYC